MCLDMGRISKRWEAIILGWSVWCFDERDEKMGITITMYPSSWSNSYYFRGQSTLLTEHVSNIILINRWNP